MFGVDLSQWQDPSLIDYDTLAAQIDFAILRIGYTGSTHGSIHYKDPAFEKHYAELTARNVPLGAYYFSLANSVERAALEAGFVLGALQGKKLLFPVFLDLESEEWQGSLGKPLLTAIVEKFCTTLNDNHWLSGYYANAWWLMDKLNPQALTPFELWLAEWTNYPPTYSGPHGIWQFASDGRLSGYNSLLDFNSSLRNYPDIIRTLGWNGQSKTPPPIVEEPVDGKPPKSRPPKKPKEDNPNKGPNPKSGKKSG